MSNFNLHIATLLFSCMLFAHNSFSQYDNLINTFQVEDIEASYIRIRGYESRQPLEYYIDWGQHWKEKRNQAIVNAKGIAIRFNGIMDLINYIVEKGWELYLIDDEYLAREEKYIKYYYLRKIKQKQDG